MQLESVVIGLGKTAVSCVRHWQSVGELPCVMDTREAPAAYASFAQRFPDVPVVCGGLDVARLKKAKQVVLSPGLSLHHPDVMSAKAQGVVIHSDIDLFIAEAKAPVIGITGSNGKSTVTALTTALLQAHGLAVLAGANFGVPALDLLSESEPDVYVLELSSFQLAISAALSLHVACVLNLSPDHLDWHGAYDDYVQAKQSIYAHAKHCVANRDDAASMPPEGVDVVIFSSAEPEDATWGMVVDAKGKRHLACGDQLVLAVDDLQIKGEHQCMNALAACALASSMGVGFDVMRQVLLAFEGLPHRCRVVRQLDGVTWVNDSKGTNPGATMASLRGMAAETQGRVFVLLGGVAKDADFSALGQLIAACKAVPVAYGQDASVIMQAMPEGVVCKVYADLAEVVAAVFNQVSAGDVVLLSPACASWDQYDGFEQRGLHFQRLVEALV